MCQYSCEDGFPSDWHLVHLGAFAKGGAGLVHFEATAVDAKGRISPQDSGLWKDEQIPSFKRIVDFIHAHGSLAALQIGHAGRKAATKSPFHGLPGPTAVPPEQGGWEPVAPSPIPYSKDYHVPKELTAEEIKDLVGQFVATTKRAEQAGFDYIELHGAHGYLIHEFLSPLSNTRTDLYGGSFENRIRFCVEVVEAVRAAWDPNKPLAIRLSCTDWVDGGWDLDQTVQLSIRLKELGVDLIDCSSAGLHEDQMKKLKEHIGPLYQVPFAAEVRKKADIPTGAVGMIITPEQAESILQNDQADVILFAREFLREPYWPIKAAIKYGLKVAVCPQYERAYL